MLRRIRAALARLLDAGWDDTDAPTYSDPATSRPEPLRTYWGGSNEPPHKHLKRGDIWYAPHGVLVWQGDHWTDAL